MNVIELGGTENSVSSLTVYVLIVLQPGLNPSDILITETGAKGKYTYGIRDPKAINTTSPMW